MSITEVKALVIKEFVLEWRQKYSLNGIILYLASTIFIVYLSFNLKGGQIDAITWNALYWIIILFTAVNAIAKSFMQESQGRFIYLYTLASPESIILAKMIYNTFLTLFLALLGFALYSLILGNPVQDVALFLITILLGALGFSLSLTLISSIAAKTQNQMLLAILGFPVIIPMLLSLIKLSKNAMDGLDWSLSYKEMITLLAINLIVGSLSFLLFAYLWRS